MCKKEYLPDKNAFESDVAIRGRTSIDGTLIHACYNLLLESILYGQDKRGLNTKIHLAVDANGMPVRFFVTAGTTADCTVAANLIDGFEAKYLLADRGYDTDAIIDLTIESGMVAVIPPKKNRKLQREYDAYIYKLRHLVENAFLHLKRWGGIDTRYAKNTGQCRKYCVNLRSQVK